MQLHQFDVVTSPVPNPLHDILSQSAATDLYFEDLSFISQRLRENLAALKRPNVLITGKSVPSSLSVFPPPL